MKEIHSFFRTTTSSTTSPLRKRSTKHAAIRSRGTTSYVTSSSFLHQSNHKNNNNNKVRGQEEEQFDENGVVLVPQVLIRRQDSESIISIIGGVQTQAGQWTNEHNIVHVLHTRFRAAATTATTPTQTTAPPPPNDAQLQRDDPTKDDMAKKKPQSDMSSTTTLIDQYSLDLLNTFTIPSIRHQSNQQFLWIIWVDSNLHVDIQTNLTNALLEIPNALPLLLQNDQHDDDDEDNDDSDKDSLLVQRQQGRNFRSLTGLEASKNRTMAALSLLSLSTNADHHRGRLWLQDYHAAAQSRLLLETRLDLGDALSKHFIESVQSHAAATLGQSSDEDQKANERSIEVYCPEDHLEWQRPNVVGEGKESSLGHLTHFYNPNFCIGTGTTIGYHVQANRISQTSANLVLPLLRDSQQLLLPLVHELVEECASDQTADDDAFGALMVKEEEDENDQAKADECNGRGTLQTSYTRDDLHRGACPTGSFFCRGNNGERLSFVGSKFSSAREVVECKVMQHGDNPARAKNNQLISILVTVSQTSAGGSKRPSAIDLEIVKEDPEYLLAAVYMQGGSAGGGYFYKWNWQNKKNTGTTATTTTTGGTPAGTFSTPDNSPVGHVDLCVIPKETVCPTKTAALKFVNNGDEEEEYAPKIRSVLEDTTEALNDRNVPHNQDAPDASAYTEEEQEQVEGNNLHAKTSTITRPNDEIENGTETTENTYEETPEVDSLADGSSAIITGVETSSAIENGFDMSDGSMITEEENLDEQEENVDEDRIPNDSVEEDGIITEKDSSLQELDDTSEVAEEEEEYSPDNGLEYACRRKLRMVDDDDDDDEVQRRSTLHHDYIRTAVFVAYAPPSASFWTSLEENTMQRRVPPRFWKVHSIPDDTFESERTQNDAWTTVMPHDYGVSMERVLALHQKYSNNVHKNMNNPA
ncbi:hypothetical protein ACA910_004180 [Epithemia clementina (nom. ined.)]